MQHLLPILKRHDVLNDVLLFFAVLNFTAAIVLGQQRARR
jgi:hypothetical protein